MNIFYLDRDPQRCAAMHCDKHVVKMILEYAQLLSTAHRVLDGDQNADSQGFYKATHKNHPSAVWVRESWAHYVKLHTILGHLLDHYLIRYKKDHKVRSSNLWWKLRFVPQNIPVNGFTDPPQCMPDYCKDDDAVVAYRTYYIKEKSYMAKWKNGNVPTWYRIGMAIEMKEAA